MYARLTGVETKTMKAYFIWVRLNTPDMFIWDDESRGIYDRFMEDVGGKDVLKDKNLYFETMMQLL
ncbi:hypothetical protein COY05_00560 [Candidatus Peregrinibacteria bacterium CG_4_10_14_0_2_um_filter_38_24]|nr:MAG: hypothetical protein COY05_00560 [Candidatus Peregrinibacteria bacterium CG_4_10_14_0_2_um_filter_38_24]